MMSGKWIEYAVGNNTLAIVNVGEQWAPSDQGTGTALEVEDFEEAIKHLKDHTCVSLLSHLRRRVVTWPSCKIPTATS